MKTNKSSILFFLLGVILLVSGCGPQNPTESSEPDFTTPTSTPSSTSGGDPTSMHALIPTPVAVERDEQGPEAEVGSAGVAASSNVNEGCLSDNATNPFQAYLKSLIHTSDKAIPSTTVDVSRNINPGTNNLPTQRISEKYQGWLFEKDLEIINLRKLAADYEDEDDNFCEGLSQMKNGHPFILALHIAFAQHLEFTMTPDMLWAVIIQGFSQHINANSEKYRSRFVSFQGKKTIEIRRDSFVSDIDKNPWDTCFPEFSDRISETIGKENVALVLNDFTTTTVASAMSMQVVLMDMVKKYFDYRVTTRCGIPKFHIKGNTRDYESMLYNIQAYREFDLGWWVDRLENIIKKFQDIVDEDKESDQEFLNSFYKYQGPKGSGSSHINGHVVGLFPYLRDDRSEEFVLNTADVPRDVYLNVFPSGRISVPFIWEYHGDERKMEFNTFSVPVLEDGSVTTKPNVQVIEQKDTGISAKRRMAS
jgi:hypothetical protein